MDYFGHTITKNGIVVDKRNLESIANWPLPKSAKAIRGFLGLTGYYRKFIKNYGGIVAPLNTMLKKGSFQWNNQFRKSFKDLKKALLSPPVL